MPRSPTQNLLASVTLRLNTKLRGHHTEFSPELCMVSPELPAGIQDLLRFHRGPVEDVAGLPIRGQEGLDGRTEFRPTCASLLQERGSLLGDLIKASSNKVSRSWPRLGQVAEYRTLSQCDERSAPASGNLSISSCGPAPSISRRGQARA